MVLESKPECFVTFGISRIMARGGTGGKIRFSSDPDSIRRIGYPQEHLVRCELVFQFRARGSGDSGDLG